MCSIQSEYCFIEDKIFDIYNSDFLQIIKGMGVNTVAGPWIAARFHKRDFPSEFILGDGQRHGNHEFINYKLKKGKKYRAFVRAYTINNVGGFVII